MVPKEETFPICFQRPIAREHRDETFRMCARGHDDLRGRHNTGEAYFQISADNDPKNVLLAVEDPDLPGRS